mmetsp:Transcript_10091/g.13127  ORF Transcript_10091/g.13127 Transcript_10091/m.13127 type:complete len:89 (+) Transcript_10091:674-940(+)
MFSITILHARLWIASFSFNPLDSTGQRIDSVEASTDATNVVPINSSIALDVSEGLMIALTTAGIAGATSGFEFVWQTASKQEPAALAT